MTASDSQTSGASTTGPLFARLTLLVFTLTILTLIGLFVWMSGGVKDGQGAVIGALALLLCLGVGGFVRWRCRIGLRSFLVVVTILAIFLSFVAKIAMRVRNVSAAAERLTKEGATVYFGLSESGWFQTSSGVLLPPWTRKVFGDAAFADVRAVDFYQTRVTPDQIRRLADACPKIDRLSFYQAKIEPNALRGLGGLDSLTQLQLTHSDAGNDDLANLGGLKQLKWLSLIGTKVTPEGMAGVRKLTALESLWCDGANASDACLKALGPQPNITNLSMGSTGNLRDKLTNDGAALIAANMPQAVWVSLNGHWSIDSEGGVALSQLKNMRHLHLSSTSIDDRTLQALVDHPSLQQIDVRATQVTWEGVQDFKKRRPDIRIGHSTLPPSAARNSGGRSTNGSTNGSESGGEALDP